MTIVSMLPMTSPSGVDNPSKSCLFIGQYPRCARSGVDGPEELRQQSTVDSVVFGLDRGQRSFALFGSLRLGGGRDGLRRAWAQIRELACDLRGIVDVGVDRTRTSWLEIRVGLVARFVAQTGIAEAGHLGRTRPGHVVWLIGVLGRRLFPFGR